jgi:hypothetical protein
MKKTIWLAAGVAGMLLGNPAIEAQGAVRVQIGRSFAIESRPNFIMLPDQGFSVAVGSPYDIVFYGNYYYICQDGSWYRSSNYRGPWRYMRRNDLPSRIRKNRLEDIRRYRDAEYSRRNHGNVMDQQRWNEDNRRHLDQQRNDENNRRNLDQKRNDEDNRRDLDRKRSDEDNRRDLDRKRSDEDNRRDLDQKRKDENRK